MAAPGSNTSALLGNNGNGIAVLSLVSSNMIPMVGPPYAMQQTVAPSVEYQMRAAPGVKPAKARKRVSFAEKPFQRRSSFPGAVRKLATALFSHKEDGWDIDPGVISLEPLADVESDLNKSSSSAKKHPNILKRKDQPLPDPIKNLPFSPSRFLNSEATTSFADVTSVSKDLNTSFGSHADDSGIENASCDTYGIFTTPSLTSTPICKSRKKFLSPSRPVHDLCSPLKQPCSMLTGCSSDILDITAEHTKSVTHCDSGNETVLKTPKIRRYLNESVPRTPTPFKCDTNSSKIESEQGYVTMQRLRSIDNDDCAEESLKSSPSGLNDRSLDFQCGPNRSLKKARKALMLDQDWPCFDIIQNEVLRRDDMPLATRLHDSCRMEPLGFIPFGSPPKCHIRSPSSLLDGGTIVKQRSFNSGKKSCFYTLHSDAAGTSKKAEDSAKWRASIELNKKWVSIACGRSEDQKAMTNAAKRYLSQHKYMSNRGTLKNAVLKQKTAYGYSIR